MPLARLTLRDVLHAHGHDVALVIGNGVNRFLPSKSTNSWPALLLSLERRFLGRVTQHIPEGISLTEYYDVLELKLGGHVSGAELQEAFCDQLRTWKPFDHHRRIVSWAMGHQSPILTTNYDDVLARAGNCTLRHASQEGFTDYYPWEAYYGVAGLMNPADSFALWHLNGMQSYKRSVRLGLTHYMGAVTRARQWIHRADERTLFTGKNIHAWRGARSWLHVIFNKPLLFFGLSLEENEVFIRWLLIERAKYFQKFPERSKPGWYVHVSEIETSGKHFFLQGVGIHPVAAANHEEIYSERTWT